MGQLREGGPKICAFEAAMRRAAEDASKGKMPAAKLLLREFDYYGLLRTDAPVDDHEGHIRIPKEWDSDAWQAMYEVYGSPPWPGQHDGLVPEERWVANYGTRTRPFRRSSRRKQ